MKDPNRFKNAIIEKTKQAMDGTSKKSTSTSLDKVRSQNQVGQRIQQTRSPPPKFKQDPNIPDKYTIFDKWVEFRDKYLAGNVNEGFRKAGYTGKFLFNSLINSNLANNLKQKAVDEASNLKNKAKSGELFSFSDKKNNQYADATSSGSWKDTLKEKFGQGAEVAKEKLGQGAEFAKEKAQEAYVYGKEVGKEQLSKGAEVAKDKLGQGAEIAKEKLGQGAEFAKEKAQEAYVYGKEVGKEQLSKGADIAKEKLGHGADIAKEKLGQGADFAKEKLGQGAQVVKDRLQEEYSQRSSSLKGQAENLSNYSKESFRSATENVSKTASSAYDSVKSVPNMAANKVYKIGKRAAILFFAGATVVAFAYAAGRQLPIAYFNYQLKKQQMDSQHDRSEETPVRNERNNNVQ